MDRDTFNRMVRMEFEELLRLLEHKGNDYAGNEDALANFKRNAERLGLTPEQVLGVYMNKHLDAIFTFIREGDVMSEPIEGRIHDAINYLLLLLAMVREKEQENFATLSGPYRADAAGVSAGVEMNQALYNARQREGK